MEEKLDRKSIRKQQLESAINTLDEAVTKDANGLDESTFNLLIDATIQRFEYTFELLWKVLKDYLEESGYIINLSSPKMIFKTAFSMGVINEDIEIIFLEMLEDRNLTTHTYNEDITRQIYANICNKYLKVIKEIYEVVKSN